MGFESNNCIPWGSNLTMSSPLCTFLFSLFFSISLEDLGLSIVDAVKPIIGDPRRNCKRTKHSQGIDISLVVGKDIQVSQIDDLGGIGGEVW